MTENRPEPCRCGSGVTTVIHKNTDPEPSFIVSCGYCPASTKEHTTRKSVVTAWNTRTRGDRTISAIGALSICSLLGRKTG